MAYFIQPHRSLASGSRPSKAILRGPSLQRTGLLYWFPLGVNHVEMMRGLGPTNTSVSTLVAQPDGGLGLVNQFNGTSHFIQYSGLILSLYNTLTVSFWGYWDSFSNNDDLFMEYTANYNSNNGILVDPNAAGGNFDIGFRLGNVSAWSFPRPSAAAWHHYLLVLNGSGATMAARALVDAVAQTLTPLVGPNAVAGSFANSALNVMSRNGGSLFGAGKIADIRIYEGDKAHLATEMYLPKTRWDLYRVGRSPRGIEYPTGDPSPPGPGLNEDFVHLQTEFGIVQDGGATPSGTFERAMIQQSGLAGGGGGGTSVGGPAVGPYVGPVFVG